MPLLPLQFHDTDPSLPHFPLRFLHSRPGNNNANNNLPIGCPNSCWQCGDSWKHIAEKIIRSERMATKPCAKKGVRTERPKEPNGISSKNRNDQRHRTGNHQRFKYVFIFCPREARGIRFTAHVYKDISICYAQNREFRGPCLQKRFLVKLRRKNIFARPSSHFRYKICFFARPWGDFRYNNVFLLAHWVFKKNGFARGSA
jgi:hypothetical protein